MLFITRFGALWIGHARMVRVEKYALRRSVRERVRELEMLERENARRNEMYERAKTEGGFKCPPLLIELPEIFLVDVAKFLPHADLRSLTDTCFSMRDLLWYKSHKRLCFSRPEPSGFHLKEDHVDAARAKDMTLMGTKVLATFAYENTGVSASFMEYLAYFKKINRQPYVPCYVEFINDRVGRHLRHVVSQLPVIVYMKYETIVKHMAEVLSQFLDECSTARIHISTKPSDRSSFEKQVEEEALKLGFKVAVRADRSGCCEIAITTVDDHKYVIVNDAVRHCLEKLQEHSTTMN